MNYDFQYAPKWEQIMMRYFELGNSDISKVMPDLRLVYPTRLAADWRTDVVYECYD
jgi:hypothetical protein